MKILSPSIFVNQAMSSYSLRQEKNASILRLGRG